MITSQINLALLASLLVVALAIEHVSCQQREGRRSGSDATGGAQSPCGTNEQIAAQVGACMRPLLDLVEGKGPNAKSDAELLACCQRFVDAERCIRTITKNCLTGVQKTAVGSVASGIKRWKNRECKSPEARARYVEPLKCAITNGPVMLRSNQNHTGMLQAIRDLDVAPEAKLMKACCVLNLIEREMNVRFDQVCPKSTEIVTGILHAMIDDAKTTLCVAPKCNNALDKVIRAPFRPPQNMFEPVIEILLQLNTKD